MMKTQRILDWLSWILIGIWLIGFGAWWFEAPIEWTYLGEGSDPLELAIGLGIIALIASIGPAVKHGVPFMQAHGMKLVMGAGIFLVAFLAQWGMNVWLDQGTLLRRLTSNLIVIGVGIPIWQYIRRHRSDR